ncbi:DUF1540 domain-containing protein [Shouchella shacheensis]|uniref:DUF1540 domain-containing protein n=1 Tax=Shouchella shacheensis TaxID=1649580 RepID=UPI000A4BDEEA|nr:DUF1540 domain-containing protein [Shouchella shacheensis]
MSKTMVKCNVANCTFWKSGNRCGADEILVEIDAHAHIDFDTEASSELSVKHEDKAKKSAETCCHTFRLAEK